MPFDIAFKKFPILLTPRLVLRDVLIDDAEALFEIKSDLQVTQRYGQEPQRKIEESLSWIQRLKDGYIKRENIAWALTLREHDINGVNRLLGVSMFWNIISESRCAEIGYELHQDYWSKGLMTEALKAILAYGFEVMELNRVEACPLAANSVSRGVMLKLGFQMEGTLRKRVFFRGEYIDQHYMGLLKEEWKF